MTGTGLGVGTPLYASPEQATASRAGVDHRSDVFSLGVILYELITGVRPVVAPTYGELLERYARRTGRDLSEIDYYRAFSSWRLAVISEGVYARFLHGAMGGQSLDQATLDGFKLETERLAEDALDALRRTT